MYWSAAVVALVPPGVVTVTSTAPASAAAGAVAVILVALTTVTPLAAVAPNLTALARLRFVPVIVTVVPPPSGPALGARPVTVGVAAYV